MLTRNCFVLILSLSVLAFLLSVGAFLHHLFTDDEEVQAQENTFTRTGNMTEDFSPKAVVVVERLEELLG